MLAKLSHVPGQGIPFKPLVGSWPGKLFTGVSELAVAELATTGVGGTALETEALEIGTAWGSASTMLANESSAKSFMLTLVEGCRELIDELKSQHQGISTFTSRVIGK
jgi:hypothetical protein